MLLSGRTQLGCPEQVSLYGYGSEKTAGVYRWEDCSRLCRQRVGCLYWTWRDRTSGTRALQCQTFTDERPSKFHNDPGAISGYRNCGFDSSFPRGPQLQCPSQGLQLWTIGSQLIRNVKSWDECARRCRANVKMRNGEVCKLWTWDKKAHSCTVMVDASGSKHRTHDINEFKHLFSGDRTCGSSSVEGNSYFTFNYLLQGCCLLSPNVVCQSVYLSVTDNVEKNDDMKT